MNVIPACLNTVINLVDKLVVKEFMKGLKGVHESKRKDAWNTRYLSLVGKLDDGFDIRRKDKKKSDEIAAFFGTEIAKEVENLYDDIVSEMRLGNVPVNVELEV